MRNPPRMLLALLFALAVTPAAAAELVEAMEQNAAGGRTVEERASVTQHRIRLGGREIAYTATAGTLRLEEEQGDAKASVFYVAYTRDGSDPATRPVMFTFNGGPGSSSVWLHMGAFGPQRVDMGREGFAPSPPYRLVANEGSLLDVTDLVFIDPVTTGYSRPAPGAEEHEFHGVEQDVRGVGDFIHRWTTRNGRWASPKLLAGESYGTTRAAGLSGYLQERHGMFLNGIVLVSSIVNFQTARFDSGNDLPYVLFLPTYTAVAHYHGQLSDALQRRPLPALLAEVRAFAEGDYMRALMLGDRLRGDRRAEIVRRLAAYTGLSEAYVDGEHARIRIGRFVKELRRDERVTVGRLDGRFSGHDRDAGGEGYEFDPSYAGIQGAYTAMLNDYVRRQLGYESDLPYEILTGRVRPWSFEGYENTYVDVGETLRAAMTRNPHLRVHVANGYYDLATPFFATEYTFARIRLGLPEALHGNISMSYYESGHMMYIREQDLRGLAAALRPFVVEAAKGGR